MELIKIFIVLLYTSFFKNVTGFLYFLSFIKWTFVIIIDTVFFYHIGIFNFHPVNPTWFIRWFLEAPVFGRKSINAFTKWAHFNLLASHICIIIFVNLLYMNKLYPKYLSQNCVIQIKHLLNIDYFSYFFNYWICWYVRIFKNIS